jgi:Kdo2-lipid IVA lauroyltransferase/acyltransferase
MQAELLKPRHWPVWLLMGYIRLGVMLPYPVQIALGHATGWLFWHAAARRRRITLKNLEMCFPELSAAERLALARRHFASMGMAIIEFGMCWWASPARIARLGPVEGVEHLKAARAQGHGVILLASHFTTLEICGRMLGLHTDLHLLYRPIPNPVIEHVQRRAREKLFDRAIQRNDVRTLLRSLKEGKPVWYATDQGYRGKNSVMVPFFGIPAPTNPGLLKLARSSQVPVVPLFGERLPGIQGYKVTVLPALEDFPTDDPVADLQRLNGLLEDHIRKVPEQYLWSHDRFKVVPRD